MKTLSRLLFLPFFIVFLASCSTTTPQDVTPWEPFEPLDNTPLALQSSHLPPTWDFIDGYKVDIIGAGMGNTRNSVPNPETLDIGDPASVTKVLVQVVLKGGDTEAVPELIFQVPNRVTITTSDGQSVIFGDGTPNSAMPTQETPIGRFYQHTFTPTSAGSISSVTALVEGTGTINLKTTRSVIAYVFRQASDQSSAGTVPNHDLFGQRDRIQATETFTLPASSTPRDISITFAISELGSEVLRGGDWIPDTRIARLEASAGGVSTYEELRFPTEGDELLVYSLTLNSVPGSVTTLSTKVISPKTPPGGDPLLFGDSIFWNGVNVNLSTVELKGCTPGYWKTHSRYGPAPSDAWPPTTFDPDNLLGGIWSNAALYHLHSKNLLEALNFRGGPGVNGGAQILLRAAAAALLNAAHPDVSYGRSTASVIADVNAALASQHRSTMLQLADELDQDNNTGCPLD